MGTVYLYHGDEFDYPVISLVLATLWGQYRRVVSRFCHLCGVFAAHVTSEWIAVRSHGTQAGPHSEPRLNADTRTQVLSAYAGFSVPVFLTGRLSVRFGLEHALLGLAAILSLIVLWPWLTGLRTLTQSNSTHLT